MIKYVISSGHSVITKLTDTEAIFSNITDKALKFDTIGEAMRIAAKVNDLLGSSTFKVINTSVSSNL